MSGRRNLTALLAGLAAQVGVVAAHTSGPDHYHAPGPLDIAGTDMALATGILVLNAIVWLLVLRAIWLHRDRAED